MQFLRYVLYLSIVNNKSIIKMKNQTLSISATNLNTNEVEFFKIAASNEFMLGLKYQKFDHANLFIDSWTLQNNNWNCGNTGINAGAYLCETMEELTGMNLN